MSLDLAGSGRQSHGIIESYKRIYVNSTSVAEKWTARMGSVEAVLLSTLTRIPFLGRRCTTVHECVDYAIDAV